MFRERPLMGWGSDPTGPCGKPGTRLGRLRVPEPHNAATASISRWPPSRACWVWRGSGCSDGRSVPRSSVWSGRAAGTSAPGDRARRELHRRRRLRADQELSYVKANEWLLWMLGGAAATLSTRRRRGRLARAAMVLAIGAVAVLPARVLLVKPLEGLGDRSFGSTGWRATASGPGAGPAPMPLNGSRSGRDPGAAAGQRSSAAGLPSGGGQRRFAGRDLGLVHPHGHWRDFAFDLGPDAAPTGVLEVVARPTFRPFRNRGSIPRWGPHVTSAGWVWRLDR